MSLQYNAKSADILSYVSYRAVVGNTIEQNCSIFSLIQILQFLIRGCKLTWVSLYNGHRVVVSDGL